MHSSSVKILNFAPAINEELQIMCVLYTEDVGGVLELIFDEDGNLEFRTSYEENDFFYDEIGSVLKIKQYQNVIFYGNNSFCCKLSTRNISL